MKLVDQALGRGWQVVAVVRHEGGLTSHDGLRVIVGDPLDEAVAASAVEGCDAVLSALGFRRHLRGPASTTLYSDRARTFVAAMEAPDLRDLRGRGARRPWRTVAYKHIVKPLWLDGGYDDLRVAEAIIGESDTDWALVRPGRWPMDRRPGATWCRRTTVRSTPTP